MYVVDPEIVGRNRGLLRLGFQSYNAYLASDLWRGIKEAVYRRKGCKCSLCGAIASCVHHNLYGIKTLTGRNFKPLHPICEKCHKPLHFVRGQYVPLAKTRELFWKRKKKLAKGSMRR